MHMFNATVRLMGAIGNEVVKYGLTVPEIIVLQHLHGMDAITKLEHQGEADIDDIDERERLTIEYNDGLANLGDELKTSIAKIFGGDYNALPDKLRGFKGPFGERDGELEDFQEPPFEEMEDVGITPMEKARQRRAAAGKRALEKRLADAKTKKNEDPEPKTVRKGGKSAIEAAL